MAAFVALAVCMGIGRFAFTPLLPMMQADAGLGLAEAGWLASANYLGYLAGALVAGALPWSSASQLRLGLGLVVLTTALMGLGHSWPLWAAWRFIAGLASAIGLVATTSLCLSRLAALGQKQKAGLMFSGVGVGIMMAGLLCMAMGLAYVPSPIAWLFMAAVALLGMFSARGLWAAPAAGPRSTPPPPAASSASQGKSIEGLSLLHHTRLVFCYGCFGFGYILPATFLPAQARQLVTDPAVFGLAWPLFGLAAALSTLAVGRVKRDYSRRHVWLGAQLIMAIGVLVPAIWSSIAAIVLAAVCVGGTFMVVTMMGMQEAQALGGVHARKLIAAVTAAFAAGQLLGPVVFSILHDMLGVSLEGALVLGCALLLLSCALLLKPFAPQPVKE
jgi:MFS family permease